MMDLKKTGKYFEYEGGALLATVEDTEVEASEVDEADDGFSFPLKGKIVEECAPRMRFAPSPTGRWAWKIAN